MSSEEKRDMCHLSIDFYLSARPVLWVKVYRGGEEFLVPQLVTKRLLYVQR